MTTHKRLVRWILLVVCLKASMRTVDCSDDAVNDDAASVYYDDAYSNIDDKNFYYNGGQGNYNKYYANYQTDDANSNGYNYQEAYQNYHNFGNNGNKNTDDASSNYNYQTDDANAAANDDANNNYYNYQTDDANAAANDDANAAANDDGNKNYDYEAVANDDEYDKQWQDDVFELDLSDGFDGVSISPVSCVNYNNGHFIKFEMYETANSYQCHFGQMGTFVVSIAHYMRAYFNYQALTYGNSFSLPDDVGYLNCIPLKMENYGFEYAYDEEDEENRESEDGPDRRRLQGEEEEEEAEKEQAILYAKVGCKYKETSTSTAFQLHVYTDDKCTQRYDDGLTDLEHARKGYEINLDKYYAANLDDDGDEIKYTDYPVNTLIFKTKVSFRPSFYKCQSCKPNQISYTFNKFAGTFYDDDFIGKNGMTRSQYNDYVEEMQANQQQNCDNCQYYTYSTDDARDDYTVQDVDDGYYATVDDDISSTFVDDYNNHDDANGNRRHLRKEKKQPFLAPEEKEFKKYEIEFWNDMNNALSHKDRSLYEDSYGGVDNWNMCEQVHKYGMYCDEDCQGLDAFSSNQWSGADIILLSIMCTFMATMMILVVAKHKRATLKLQKQQSFYSDNDFSGVNHSSVPGLPPAAMLTIFCAIMLTIIAMALIRFVNETLVFAVVCCILLFIYMLKITLFSVNKRPVLLASPNHEDVFEYNNADFATQKGGFFS